MSTETANRLKIAPYCPTRIFCYQCCYPSKTIEPIFLYRYRDDKFRVTGVCDRCNAAKTKLIHDDYKNKFPAICYQIPKFSTHINKIEYNGEVCSIVNLLENMKFYP